jgi:hypothetical protein
MKTPAGRPRRRQARSRRLPPGDRLPVVPLPARNVVPSPTSRGRATHHGIGCGAVARRPSRKGTAVTTSSRRACSARSRRRRFATALRQRGHRAYVEAAQVPGVAPGSAWDRPLQDEEGGRGVSADFPAQEFPCAVFGRAAQGEAARVTPRGCGHGWKTDAADDKPRNAGHRPARRRRTDLPLVSFRDEARRSAIMRRIAI